MTDPPGARVKLPFVLLAAGQSTRMGTSKALLEFKGRPWLRVQVEAIRHQTEGPLRVVLAPGATREAALLAGLAGVETLVNPAPEIGPFGSLQKGLEGLRGPVFIGPLDCPVAPVFTILARGLSGGIEAVIPTHGGRGGHPVCLDEGLVARLQALDPRQPEARLDQQLRLARQLRLEVGDPRVLLNLNDPATWAAYQAAQAD